MKCQRRYIEWYVWLFYGLGLKLKENAGCSFNTCSKNLVVVRISVPSSGCILSFYIVYIVITKIMLADQPGHKRLKNQPAWEQPLHLDPNEVEVTNSKRYVH